ncbi:hypothetical protein EZJ43_01265 [Pedobacter changchengzhani]|uniref:Uncharacterized protein n=1 Tax=Pedobacter changchengzhani TaxID=2529274 RepID=A0A4R5MPK7_9SPHI|nr:hypothetical protein [Pedobacter changchengzhani]TDG37752.1 hypothetical protein EZJ43_01265 [Pedobacter changchengzhani]
MENAVIISGIISLIALIVFFIMSSNIGKIRDHIKSIDKPIWYNEYTKRKFMKRPNAEILFALQENVWQQIMLKPSVKNYEALKERWANEFISLGAEFPEYPFK